MELLELAEVKQHYYDLYHCAPIAYCCIDAEGHILEANLRAAELFGGSVEDLRGQRLSRFILNDAARSLSRLQQRPSIYASDTRPFEVELRSLAGAERSVLAVLTTLFSGDDETPLGRVTFVDVTRRSRPQEERDDGLCQRTPDTESLEPVEKLAATIAHDFNNLLAGILASVTLLEFEHTDQLARTEHLNDIRALTERGARLTRQLLGIARGGKLHLVPIDFTAMLESIADTFQRMHEGLVVRLTPSTSTRQLLADRSQIEQMLTSLLTNACDAMGGRGEVRVGLEEIELTDRDVQRYRVQPGAYFKLTIGGSGLGMGEGAWRGVFERFCGARDPASGHGLGHVPVGSIVRNHRGFIAVASVPGQGSSFALYLPSSPRIPPTVPSIAKDASSRPQGTLLLVDDEEQIARGWSRTLRHLGYEVVAVRSGEEAIEHVRREPSRFSLVILDLAMPGMGGRKACDQIHQIAPSLKILVWSGYCSEGVATDLMAHGCCGFIQKPPSVDALSAKLRELL